MHNVFKVKCNLLDLSIIKLNIIQDEIDMELDDFHEIKSLNVLNILISRWARKNSMQDLCQLDQLLSVQEEASNEGWEPDWWPQRWSQTLGSSGGSQRWKAAHGERSCTQKTSLSQQHQYGLGVSQGQEGE